MDRWIGVISDTHGLLRPQAVVPLRGCLQITHAGDVGKPEVLDQLRTLAPTIAVRGNVDHGEWAQTLPLKETLTTNGVAIHVLHDLHTLDIDPVKNRIGVVISGHSHQPCIETRNGVLYLNPGAAGPQRFRLPVTLARLEFSNKGPANAKLIDLLTGRSI